MKHIVEYDGGSIGFATKREADAFRKEEADAKAFGNKRSKTAQEHMKATKQFKAAIGHCGGLGFTY